MYYCANELNQYEALDDAAGCESPFTREFTHDADGNMTGDGDLALVYDAENRLIEVAPASPGSGDKKQVFVYDYRNRRIQITTYEHDGSAWGGTPVAQSRFVWDGWLLIAELDGLDDNAPLRRWTWGLDLAGQRGGRPGDAAGGIGGLLAVDDATVGGMAEYLYAFDAHGNVTDVVDLAPSTWGSGVRQARYDYTPYGALRTHSGAYALANKFRFSTKTWDDESGLGYWGERYYHPGYGRWVNRDPIGELGGSNIYAYVQNSAGDQVDPFGLMGCRQEPIAPPPPPLICGPNPNPNPTDADCCNAARATCGNGDGGGVICCDGRKVSCSFWQPPNPPNPGDPILEACIVFHEDDHHDDVSCGNCPTGQICRPFYLPEKNPNNEECSAYWKEIDCLLEHAQTTCHASGTAADRVACANRVLGRIKQQCDNMKNTYKCHKRPVICDSWYLNAHY